MLKVAKSGYLPAKKAVLVTDDAVRQVAFQLEIDRQQIPDGQVTVRTSPPTGCDVFIDDRPVGLSPVRDVRIRPGPRVVRVQCENYGTEQRPIRVKPNKSLDVSFALEPVVFGYLTVIPTPAKGSQVRIDSQRVPLPVEFVKVVPGRHNVEVANERLNKRKRITVDVPANARISRVVNLLQ